MITFYYSLGSLAYIVGNVMFYALLGTRAGKPPAPDILLIYAAIWPVVILELISVRLYRLLEWSLGHGHEASTSTRAQPSQIECRRCGATTSRLGFFCRHCGAAIKRQRRRRRPPTPFDQQGGRQ